MKRFLMNTIAAAAAALAVSACIYPFEPEAQGEGGRMVIEGDILIGEETIVNLSYTAPIGGALQREAPEAQVWVKDENGNIYGGLYRETTEDNIAVYAIDTKEADPSLKYSLHVRNLTDLKTYETELLDVHKGAEIDSLTYILDAERGLFNVGISVHTTGESYFRWTYSEDWEFHSDYGSYLVYDTMTREMRTRTYEEDIYTCWGHDTSSEIIIFSTESQTEDRFVDLEFRTIENTDRKISRLYYIEVQIEAMSKDAYDYWNNVKTNSEYSGSLFSPNPSEMVGNIRCVEDPNELVIGYINAAMRSTKSMFYDNTFIAFFKRKYPAADTKKDLQTRYWATTASQGAWIPLYYPDPMDTSNATWGLAICTDCRRMGGTKTRPPHFPLP